MTYDLRELTKTVIAETFGIDMIPVFSRTDPQHGDFTTNVAMQLSGQLGQSPRDIAEQIITVLKTRADLEMSIAGPGFINIRLSDQEIFAAALQATTLARPLEGKVIVSEYSDPNPFKILHAGHLYTSLVGDAVSNIMQAAGAEVHRVNFGGDVGRHVAITMWAILEELGGEFPEKLGSIPEENRLEWVSGLYTKGNTAFESSEAVKQAVIELNQRVYEVHAQNDFDTAFAQIYWTCRKWSYEGFDALYSELGMQPFEKYYPESAVSDLGLKTVQAHIGDVYQESDGAIVFRGEGYGLFTQVFINSQGLPTYAGKDVGLIQQKYADFHFDQSFIITDVSQRDHMKVVLKSIEQFEPALVAATIHHTHGRIKLQGNVKMSSRLGNFVSASDILEAAYSASTEATGKDDPAVVLGAVRYSFLRSRIGGDIIYDPKESVSIEGNSGPYVQYALVRARSIIRKVSDVPIAETVEDLDQLERSLARQISMYPEAFASALHDYSPHHICGYLYDLAVTFNRFYEQSRVIDHERANVRVALVTAYEAVLSQGLHLLGMPQPEHM